MRTVRVDGLVVPAGDTSALARAIHRLYDDPYLREEFVASAQQRSLSQFPIAASAARLVGAYQSLATDTASRAASVDTLPWAIIATTKNSLLLSVPS